MKGGDIVYLERVESTTPDGKIRCIRSGIVVHEYAPSCELNALRSALSRTSDERNFWRERCARLETELVRLKYPGRDGGDAA